MPEAISSQRVNIIMRLVPSAALAAVVAAFVLPGAASAGCYNCYTPPPCVTCYQQQVIPPQYRTVEETVMVSPGRVIAHRTPGPLRDRDGPARP